MQGAVAALSNHTSLRSLSSLAEVRVVAVLLLLLKGVEIGLVVGADRLDVAHLCRGMTRQ